MGTNSFADSVEVFQTAGAPGVATSGTNTYKSISSVPNGEGDITYQVITTGTLTGALTVEISNSKKHVSDAAAEWSTYLDLTPPDISGAMSFPLKMTRMKFGRVRLSYTNATNTGTIRALEKQG